MSLKRALSGPWSTPIIFGMMLRDARDAPADNSCVTAQCHATLLTPKIVHPPSESCDSCHESVAMPHPPKGTKTFKLTQEPPELCTAACHDAFGTKSDVHAPVKEGMCTTCHDPHSASEPKLLTQPMKELCTSCHEDEANLPHVHGPVSAGQCTACHSPHESDINPLLLKKDDELCLGCHVDVQELLKKPDVHPAMEGGCTSCHNPHGSAHPKLLADEGAAAFFACHDEIGEKVEKAPVVHAAVKGEKGCASCHSPHASDNAKLLLAPEKNEAGFHEESLRRASGERKYCETQLPAHQIRIDPVRKTAVTARDRRPAGFFHSPAGEFTQRGASQKRRTPHRPAGSDRVQAALEVVAEGNSNKEVAETLGISVKTAMAHREYLMEQLDVHSRTELIRFALRRGVIRV